MTLHPQNCLVSLALEASLNASLACWSCAIALDATHATRVAVATGWCATHDGKGRLYGGYMPLAMAKNTFVLLVYLTVDPFSAVDNENAHSTVVARVVGVFPN